MGHDNEIRKLMEYKEKIEEREQQNANTRARREALLDQAKALYGVNSIEELEKHKDTLYKDYQAAMQEVQALNAQLAVFFGG